MAERRMFSKTVINSARFLRMPPSSRLLYYDLGMAADDDGIVEAFTVMRTTGATEDDLRVLVAKGFIVILNDDFVAYITDWCANNQIRADRRKPSVYTELLVRFLDDNQMATSGIPDDNQMTTSGIPDDNRLSAQVSIVKESIVKGNMEGGAGGPAPKRKRFIPPTFSELQAYIREQSYNVDARRFLDHYEAVGWKVGKNPMRDWRAAVRTWNNREKDQQPKVVPRPENDISDLTNLYD